ncbi:MULTISPECIES: hypothetical protein [unclassified Streptomyces]|uniref:hypothetical protein n=1 Tax=unclassified Streptomyces TaxID=2593676 RepID=UPI000DC7E11B|nr:MULTISPECIES: hypothetical protein [unclassified Streptomyces]AWZ07496.1 hypothetical protein DRB89_26055 [Streptomyces sp. ICC4]AWZ16633.1 hypothetical protein DRB96_35570 [Streptomyces sp. ICC1]
MSKKPSPTAPATPTALPRRLTAAAALTALEGLALAGLGVYMLYMGVAGDVDSVRQAEAGGITWILVAALPLFAARGLRLGRRWSRGPTLITQLLALPVAWNLWTAGGAMAVAGVALALAAVAVVGILLNPTATEALGFQAGE